MLANGFLTTSDQFAALFFLAAVASQWTLLNYPTPAMLSLASVTVAGLLLCKFSGVLILPISVLLFGVRLTIGPPLATVLVSSHFAYRRKAQFVAFALLLVVQAMGVVLLIWASYGFRYTACVPGDEAAQFEIPWQDVEAGVPPRLASVLSFARAQCLLPESYLYGFATTVMTSQSAQWLPERRV